MNKIFYLNTCDTNRRIMKEIGVDDSWEQQEIKTNPITEKQLEELKEKVGSYENLFSKRAIKYRTLGLKDMKLTEEDYKKYLLEDYTFLKRPVVLIDDEIFVGNSKKTIEAIKAKLGM